MVVSSSATTALEDVAAAGGPSMRRWFQLSLSSRKVINLDLAQSVGLVPPFLEQPMCSALLFIQWVKDSPQEGKELSSIAPCIPSLAYLLALS